MAFSIEKIEEKIDKVVTGGIELSDDGGGIEIKRLVDAMEVAKMLAISGPAVPGFMRGQPGICYAAVVRAVRWKMDPFFVAEQSYLVNNKGEEKIAFMAQLIVAVINARAPLQKKLRVEYAGEGDGLRATICGLPKGQTEELTYDTPTLGELIKARGKNDYGKLKGSPLYETDPRQQLWYYGARGFCRRHFPEVLAGVYDVDEFEPIEPKDVTPERATLSQRLKGQKKIESSRGFNAEHVTRATQQSGDDNVAAERTDPVGNASGPVAAPSSEGDPGDGAAPNDAVVPATSEQE